MARTIAGNSFAEVFRNIEADQEVYDAQERSAAATLAAWLESHDRNKLALRPDSTSAEREANLREHDRLWETRPFTGNPFSVGASFKQVAVGPVQFTVWPDIGGPGMNVGVDRIA